MNKTEFTRKLAEGNGITYKQAGEEVDRFLGTVEEILPTLGHEESLNLTGYFKFTVKEVPEREARNPQNGESVTVPAGKQVRASVGSTLKQAIK